MHSNALAMHSNALALDAMHIDAMHDVFSGEVQELAFRTPRDLPWESPFMRGIMGQKSTAIPSFFDSNGLPPVKRFKSESVPASAIDVDVEGLAMAEKHATIWPQVVKRLRDLPWTSTEDSLLQRALNRWHVIIVEAPMHSEVGRMLLSNVTKLKTDQYIVETLRNIFAKKAPRTLLKRAGDLMKFFIWAKSVGMVPVPISEEAFHDYVCCMENAGCAATAIASCVSAVAFAGHMLGVDGALQAVASKRVQGVSFRHASTKRPWRPMQPLSVLAVKTLEHFCAHSECVQDRVFSGQCLFTLYSRGRWSDTMHVKGFAMDVDANDEGYLVAMGTRTKTGNTAQKKSMFLPLAAPVPGLRAKDPWFHSWMKARVDTGLSGWSEDIPSGECAMPAPSHDGGWCKRPLSSYEAVSWLREILDRQLPGFTASVRVGSHSLKKTPLGWCAIWGLSMDDRATLGYHIRAQDNSVMHYSADAQAAPLRRFKMVIANIRAGVFQPDSWRPGVVRRPECIVVSNEDEDMEELIAFGRVVEPQEPRDDPLQSVPVMEVDLSGAEDTSSSSSEESSAEDSDDDDVESVWAPPARGASRNAGPLMYRHSKLGTIHSESSLDDAKLACGKVLHAVYVRFEDSDVFPWPRCKGCFGRR